jgi:PAS domain S-box-containing protein
MHESPSGKSAFGIGLLAAVVALVVRWQLHPVLGDRALYSTFLPAVMIAAYLGGFRPAILVTLLSALAGNYFLVEPLFVVGLKGTGNLVALILFLLTGAFISGLSESLHRVQRRIIAHERQRAEEILRQSEGRLRQLADLLRLSYDAIVVWKPDGGIKTWSRGAEELYGFAEAEALGRVTHELLRTVHPVPWPEIEAKLRASGSWEGELRHRTKEGREVIVSSRQQMVRDADRDWSVLESNRDITERKRAEELLRESEHRWRSLTEALPQLVWTATPDGACDYFSTQWTDHTGIPKSDLLGWRWLETLHPHDREATRQFWLESVAGRHPYDVEYRVRRHDGEYRWFKTRGVPIRDSAGDIFKWFGTCTDMTDSKLAAAELRLAKEAAESANRAKDEFLANVSHEIRTPMNAILGMTELVLDTPLGDDQRQSLRTVKSASDNLLSIINDLLDFSKIEAGKLELDPTPFSLRTALGDTLRALAVRAHRKGLELVCQVQPDVPDAMVGDAGRLRQVLLNLVGNAVKFTDEGEVVVRVERTKDVGGRMHEDNETSDVILHPSSFILFSVRDTGIGIPQERQEGIFRAFEQEDTSTTRKYGGTGLGLTISARLTALMGGQITVESKPGQGSTFAFTARFGLQPHAPEPLPVRPPVPLQDLPVLIVDDNATNRHILEEWLRAWQMKPVAVGDGLAAMDALWHGAASGRPYALVLLDARMPDVDGLALATEIRQRAEQSCTRIILLTSGDRPGDLARFRELRVNAHLLKPVQQDELLETIYQVLRKDEGGRMKDENEKTSASDSSFILQPSSFPLNILVAEDNEFSAQLLEQLLVRRGHRVRLANNGRVALSLAEEASFDVLLLDVHMPELDGFQVSEAIRERERSVGGHLPVIALTARSRKEDRDRCLAAGMDDFLAKPIQADDLWAAIDRVLRKDAGRRMQDEKAKRSASDSSFILPPSSFREDLLDARVLLAACGGDAVILEKICQSFRAGLPGHLIAIQDALTMRDASGLREAAHRLCGMVSAFSTIAGRVASDLEDRAAQGQFEEALPVVGQLENMADQLVRLAGGLSLESLRQQVAAGGDSGRTSIS